MSPQYEIPQRVLANAEKRLAVTQARLHRMCATPGCDQAATHSPCTGHDSCETHRITPPMPTPDPSRTLRALQERLADEIAQKEANA